ncbi:MAG TPA: ABC transporter permease [Acidobacteriota bacterium]|nr:ABC transporter permease [Acidobacteriota bacterium]
MKLNIPITEILRTASQALLRNWGRAVLTSLSMVVGTASLVLVVVVGISGREFTLEQIRGVGTNLIIVSNEAEAGIDRINFSDLKAIQTEVPGVMNSAAVITAHPTFMMDGISRRVTLIGTTPEYQEVRNIEVVSGNFIKHSDLRFRNKVCLITQPFADRLERDPFYNGYLTFYGIRFQVIGIFRERTDTFGNTEVSDYSALMPLDVVRDFKADDTIDFIYVSAENMEIVPHLSEEIRNLLIHRHRNQDLYRVDNLAGVLDAANRISLGLTVVLLVIAAISLIASGISIMNVMLITVTERTREIGIKKSIGAYRRVLLTEFLVEALILSCAGGLVGIILGAGVPFSVRFFTTAIQIEIPLMAIVLGFGVTVLVGLTFGMLPALKAARMNPVEALRYE